MIGMSSNTVNRIEWATAYFTASADNEPFEDVSIITAKSAYLELACTAAADMLLRQSTKTSDARLHQTDVLDCAAHIMNEGKVFIQEHVKVAPEGISICINAVNVEDEDAVWRALDLLADALGELDGAHGTVYFGDVLRFTSGEIPWSNTH